jgi:subtilisin family serine protease
VSPALALAGLAVALWSAGAGAEPPPAAVSSASGKSQPYAPRWWREHIGLDDAPEAGRREHCADPQPVTVAVIDTGVDYLHPDLPRTQLWVNAAERLNGLDDDHDGYVDDLIGWNFVDGDNNPWDDSGHGTLVAGLIAARAGAASPGVNPAARIMALKVLNALGYGRSSDLAAAVDFAVAHGARVINLSLGAAELGDVGRRAVRRAIEAGTLVVVAAGNGGRDTDGFGLADLDGVLTVAATGPDDRRARFANYGRAVKLAAPGVDVLGLRARGSDLIAFSGASAYRAGAAIVGAEGRYYRASGTSFAAAIVSGAASLVISCRPALTGVEAGRVLVQSARSTGAAGVNLLTGYGVLDVRAALAADPKFWIQAEIDSVKLAGDPPSPTLRVSGSADASEFQGARLRAAPADFPDDWIELGAPLTAAVHAAPLVEVDTRLLRGPRRWILQLVTVGAGGRSREARFGVDLGGAP